MAQGAASGVKGGSGVRGSARALRWGLGAGLGVRMGQCSDVGPRQGVNKVVVQAQQARAGRMGTSGSRRASAAVIVTSGVQIRRDEPAEQRGSAGRLGHRRTLLPRAQNGELGRCDQSSKRSAAVGPARDSPGVSGVPPPKCAAWWCFQPSRGRTAALVCHVYSHCRATAAGVHTSTNGSHSPPPSLWPCAAASPTPSPSGAAR